MASGLDYGVPSERSSRLRGMMRPVLAFGIAVVLVVAFGLMLRTATTMSGWAVAGLTGVVAGIVAVLLLTRRS
jgi:type IV secretory pathway VirB2 component (pilin)